jgi:hypothetical protein
VFVFLATVLRASVALAQPEPASRLNVTVQAPEGCAIGEPIPNLCRRSARNRGGISYVERQLRLE